MSSEKPKTKRDEKRLYEPIRECLQRLFENFYIEHEKRYQSVPFEHEENPYLEVIGDTKRFSEKLKKVFDSETLNLIISEGIFPDIVGYVQKKSKSQKEKEIITVEVKDKPIKLKHIAQAKFYQDVFNATFGLLISSKEIPELIVRHMLENPRGKVIRGRVIIAQSVEEPIVYYSPQHGYFTTLEINSKFKDSVPDPFKQLCKP